MMEVRQLTIKHTNTPITKNNNILTTKVMEYIRRISNSGTGNLTSSLDPVIIKIDNLKPKKCKTEDM